MAEQPATDGATESRPIADAADGGKRLDDKKANLRSDVKDATGQAELNGEVMANQHKRDREIPRPRGRPRKIRSDEAADNKNDVYMIKTLRPRKRTFSESEEDFIGFDILDQNVHLHALEIINKYLAEIKNISPLPSKRIRRPTVKVLENADTEASENLSASIAHRRDGQDTEQECRSIARSHDTDVESEIEDTVVGMSDQESEQKEESPATMSSVQTPGRRGRRPSNLAGASPKQGVKSEYKKPSELGWTRELVQRGSNDTLQVRIEKIPNVSSDNATFAKKAIGMKKPMEIVRDAKSVNQNQSDNATLNKSSTVATPLAESDTSKVEIPAQKKVAAKRGRPRLTPKSDPATTVTTENDAATSSLPKNKPKDTSIDAQTSPKKGIFTKKEAVKGSTMTRRSQQSQSSTQSPESESIDLTATEEQQTPTTEKSVKSYKRLNKRTSVQEPCSIRCLTSTGGIPSLQCTICLCLYHAECVGCLEEEVGNNYICKNCKDVSNETLQPTTSTLTPPPLIPISLLGSNSAAKYKPQGLMPLLKLQKNNREESQASKLLKSNTNLLKFNPNVKLNEKKKDVFGVHDLPSSLPAQNLAIMNNKKYIVIPKDNVMAVQPAITIKRDKLREPTIATSAKHEVQNSSRLETGTLSFDQFSKRHVEDLMKTNEDESKKNKSNKSDDNNKSDGNNENYDNNKSDKIESLTEHFDTPIIEHTEKSNAENNEIKINEVSTHEIIAADAGKCNINTEVLEGDERKKFITTTPTTEGETDQCRYNVMANVCAMYDAFSHVLQYLTVQELLRTSRVCKMWRDSVANPLLWRTVRMKNSQVTDWDGFAEALNRYKTQHLDLRKILISDGENIWEKFIEVLPKIKSLKKLELCRCPGNVVEAVIQNCPQLETFSAMSIRCDMINLSMIKNFRNCTELRLKAVTGMTLFDNMDPLCQLTQLVHLSLTSVKELGKKNIELVINLVNLEVLELGECSDLPVKFGTEIISKLPKLERLRLEKGQGNCATFNILEGVSQSPNLTQLELVNFDIKKGFDIRLAKCVNIKRLLIIPTYISQSATSNHMILNGVTQLKETLTNFIWGVTLELLRVTDLFVDQSTELKKRIKGDAIPVLKPMPCAELIKNILKDTVKNAENTELAEMERRNTEDQTNEDDLPEVDILTLLQLQKLLLLALPTTRVKILKIPFHATWRQSLLDSAMQ